MARRGLKCAVAVVPKTIDNDVPVIDKSFGFATAVEAAVPHIVAAATEAAACPNGVGVVKLMGRHSGFIAMHATLASGDVDLCLIPESESVPNSNLQRDFNVSVFESFDASSSTLLRELDEGDRFVQKSAESTSM